MADLANSNIFLEHKLTPEQKLWKAVLSQGVYEACSKKAQALPLTYGEMRSALNGLTYPTETSYKYVCLQVMTLRIFIEKQKEK